MWQLVYQVSGSDPVTIPLENGRKYLLGRTAERSPGVSNDIILADKTISKACATLEVGKWKGVEPPLLHLENESFKSLAKGMPTQTPREKKPLQVTKPRGENAEDVETTHETGKFAIEHGTRVRLTSIKELIFNWIPISFFTTDKSAAMIETAESLRKWGISVNEHIRTATHVIVHGEITGDDPNLIGVSRGLQFVTPSYLTTLSSTLEEFSKPTDLKQGFVMPVAETPHPRFEDERREASWWNPQPERASVWNGKVIVFLIAKNESVAARRYVGFSGAETELIDITSRPILSPHDLMKKLAPIQQKAREVAQAANMPEDDALIVAITDGALHRYNGVDIPVDSNILTQSLTDAKIPFGSSLHWWRALTRCQWRDFVADDEEEEMSQAPAATGTSAAVEASPTCIPSTHPEEANDVEMQPQEEAPRVKRPLKRRAGKPRELEDDDLLLAAVEEPSKRQKIGEAPKEIAQETVQSRSAAATPARKLVRRARERSIDLIMDDVPEEEEDPLAKYRDTYNRVASGAAASPSESAPPAGKSNESSFTPSLQPSAFSRVAETQVPTSTSALSQTPLAKVAEVNKSGVSYDGGFLKEVRRLEKEAKKAAQDVDKDFADLSLGNGKGKGKKKSTYAPLAPVGIDYSVVDDFDGDLRGNFTVVTKMNLFRKDLGKQGPAPADPRWNGVPNFKKFKQKNVVRREPFPLKLAPKADYGLGDGYWEAQRPPRSLPLENSQPKGLSQVEPTPTASNKGAVGRRKLLKADSDDEQDGFLAPRSRTTSRQTSVEPTPAPKKRSRKKSPPVISGPVDLSLGPNPHNDFDDDVGLRPAKRSRRDESSIASRTLSSGKSSTAATTTTTGKRRLLAVAEDDDDDEVIFAGTGRRGF